MTGNTDEEITKRIGTGDKEHETTYALHSPYLLYINDGHSRICPTAHQRYPI